MNDKIQVKGAKKNWFWLGTLFLPLLCYSQQRGVEAVTASETVSRETYALVIGISIYEKFNRLNYADADALAFAEYLQSKSGLHVPAENIRVLLNENAKNGDILENGMVWLEQMCKPNSRAIIYFAGHGVSVGNNSAYLMAYNVSPQFNKANIFYSGGIPMFNIKRDFIAPMSQKGIEVILIIDACRSFDAVAGKEGLTLLSQSTLDDNTGEIRIISSSNAQQSFEDVPGNLVWSGHGVFTYFLLQGLYGKADYNKDSLISLSEIKRFLQIKIPEETNFKQEPAFCCDQNLTSFVGEVHPAGEPPEFLKPGTGNSSGASLAMNTGRGIVQQAAVPDEVKPVVDSFYSNLAAKNLFGNRGADFYFLEIQRLDSQYVSIKKEVLLNYCGLLSNDVQHTINLYLDADIKSARESFEMEGKTDDGFQEGRTRKIKKEFQWEDIFHQAAHEAERLYQLRISFFPDHPYNQTAEMKYYFTMSRSYYNVNHDSSLYFIS
ncbi:MAG: caspase family protein, partial [Bacteroidales bacterium]|nr:caspase family protein [Bacteroidales bacterium]